MSEVVTFAETPGLERPQPNGAAPTVPASLTPALERLLSANQIRELASFPRPVLAADVAHLPAIVIRVAQRIYRASQRVEKKPSAWRLLRWMLIDAATLLALRLLLSRGRIWRLGRETFGTLVRNAVFHQLRYHARPASTITGYVRVSDKEHPLIRVCLLLRTMKRYGACVDFLAQRLRSGLPTEQTRRWLAFFLREIGNAEAAAQLVPETILDEGELLAVPPPQEPVAISSSRRFKCAVLIVTMFDSPVFRRSLLSLAESDFQGQIVVVEDGYQPQRECEAFCRELGVTYVKNPEWTGCSAGVNLGMRAMKPETDIVTYAQNDILWPPQWCEHLDHAWRIMEPSGKAGLINLGYVQANPGTDPAFRELFLNGDYEDWLWAFKMAKEVQPLSDSFRDLQNHDLSRLFGLGRDAWADRPAEFKIMLGKFSVAGSFRTDTWRALGGFASELPFGNDIELQYHSCANRKWNLWINNRPLIHLASSDTSRLTRPGDHVKHQQLCRQTYEGFAQKYGCEVDHFFWTWYAETCVIYHDEIVDAVNALRFDEIDFIFDDLFERLKRKRLSSCELMSCLSRPRCRYV